MDRNSLAPVRAITGYHTDAEGHWVAELACCHLQHVRHDPPWQNRPWVTTVAGRQALLGHRLPCVRCLRGEPPSSPVPEDPTAQG